jgi:hypothetical protein
MKNIDSEVANFHQKMAKSMHSLLKAFTEGFEAMDKAKAEELVEIKNRRKKKRSEKRIKKMEKIEKGISNLQILTTKLKSTFQPNDDSKESDDINVQTNIQTKENLQISNSTQ